MGGASNGTLFVVKSVHVRNHIVRLCPKIMRGPLPSYTPLLPTTFVSPQGLLIVASNSQNEAQFMTQFISL